MVKINFKTRMASSKIQNTPPSSNSVEAKEPHRRPYRWVILALLWLLYVGHGIVSRSAAPLVTPMLRDLNMLYGQMGLVLGSWQLTYIAVAVFAGILMDRWGVRKSLFLGVLVIGLSVLLRYFVNGFLTLLFTVALFGLGGPMISIGAPKAISLWFRGKERGTAVGIYTTGSRMGQMLALAATNGIIMPLTGYSWRLTFACYGFLIITIALLWWFVATDIPVQADEKRLPTLRLFANLIKVRNVRIILVCGLLTFSITHGFTNWLPKLLETRGMTPTMAGYASAIPLVACLPSIVLIPRMVPPHLRSRMAALLALLAAVAIMLVATSALPLLVGLLLFGVSAPTLPPMFMLILMDLPEVGARYMGSIGGVYFTIAEIGGFLGPFVLGALVDLTGTFLSGASFIAFLGLVIVALTLLLRTPSIPNEPRPH